MSNIVKSTNINGRNKRKKISDDKLKVPDKESKFAKMVEQGGSNNMLGDEPIAEDNNNAPVEDNNDIIFDEFYVNNQYCKTKDDSEFYAIDKDGNQIFCENAYAKQTVTTPGGTQEIHEVAPLNKDKKATYLEINGILILPENVTKKTLIFPKDPSTGDEIYLETKQGSLGYPQNKQGKEFYRRDAIGRDIPLDALGYAESENNSQIYPRDENGSEWYMTRKEGVKDLPCDIVASKNVNGEKVYFYAKRSDLDEFYPKRYLSEDYIKPYWSDV